MVGDKLVAEADLLSRHEDDEQFALVVDDEDYDEIDVAAEVSELRLFFGGEEPGPEGEFDLTTNPEPAGGR